MTTLSQRVKKILNARNVQKQRIEGEFEDAELHLESIAKQQEPIVKTIKEAQETQTDALKNIQLALQQQQQQQQQQNVQPLQQQEIPAINIEQEESASQDKWVQNLYRSYNSNKNKLTQMEANLKGKIGESGTIDLPLLYNENVLEIKADGKGDFNVPEKDLTPGLVALLLLPYKDFKGKITPTKKDINLYSDIMSYVGVAANRSDKYSKIYKKYRNPSSALFSDEFASADSEVENSDTEVNTTPLLKPTGPLVKKSKLKLGTGCTYNSPEELGTRLNLLAGSYRAGNTSKDLQQEMRHILDEMLQQGQLPFTLHRKLYERFDLK